MSTIAALRAERAAKAKEIDALVKKDGKWHDAVDQPIYDAAMKEIDRIDASIKRISDANEKIAAIAFDERVGEAGAKMERDAQSPHAALYAKWLRGGDTALSPQDGGRVRASMATTTPGEGGFTVQTDVARTIVDALKAFGGMRDVAEVLSMTSGNPMQFPTSNGTSEEGEIIAENQTAGDADIDFGSVALPVYKYSSKTVAVPIELLQDSQVDIESFVNQRLATRLGRVTNKHFTIGSGVSQPRGLATAAPVGVTAANGTSQVNAATYDSLVDLQHSVDPAYRRNAGFMMNDLSVRQVRKVKDQNNRPIFVPGYETGVPGGAPDTLLGAPITVNQDVAVMAAGARSILYGDFSAYKIRDVMGITLFRFTDSVYAKKGQVGFLAWMRSGGNLVDVGGAVKVFVNAAS